MGGTGSKCSFIVIGVWGRDTRFGIAVFTCTVRVRVFLLQWNYLFFEAVDFFRSEERRVGKEC